MSNGDSKEISILLEGEVIAALEELKLSLGTGNEYTDTDVFQDAITFYHWALIQHKKGRSIAATNGGKPVLRIELPFKD